MRILRKINSDLFFIGCDSKRHFFHQIFAHISVGRYSDSVSYGRFPVFDGFFMFAFFDEKGNFGIIESENYQTADT